MNTIETTKDLIQFKTVEGNNQQTEKCLQYIKNTFSEEFQFHELEKEGEKSLLIKKQEDIEILLHGHIDVVEAEDSLFEPKEEKGRLYGRGTADMKSGVACLMKVIQETKLEDVGLLITSDEERGGFKGTGHVIEQTDINPSLVISAEPDDSGNFPSIVTKQKGVLQLKISTRGKSAHSSKPDKGENAAEKLIQKYLEIRKLFNHKKEFPTTINLSNLSSNGQTNQVPDKASLTLDIRYTQQYNDKEVLNDLSNIEGIQTKVLAEAPMLQTSENQEKIRVLKKTVEETTTQKPDFRKENFASDMRFFTEKGIPAICFGPEGYNLHGKQEYVEIESIEIYCEILKNFLDRVEM